MGSPFSDLVGDTPSLPQAWREFNVSVPEEQNYLKITLRVQYAAWQQRISRSYRWPDGTPLGDPMFATANPDEEGKDSTLVGVTGRQSLRMPLHSKNE